VWLTPHPRDLIQPEGERERVGCFCRVVTASLFVINYLVAKKEMVIETEYHFGRIFSD